MENLKVKLHNINRSNLWVDYFLVHEDTKTLYCAAFYILGKEWTWFDARNSGNWVLVSHYEI